MPRSTSKINIPGYKVVFTQHPSNAVRLRVTNGQCCQMGKPRRLPASSDGGGSGAVGSRAGKWLAIYSFGGQISDTPLLCPSQRVNRLLDILCSKYRICLPILLPLSKPLVTAVVDREFFKDLLVVDNEMRVASLSRIMKSFGSDSYFWCEVIFPNKIFRAVIQLPWTLKDDPSLYSLCHSSLRGNN